MTDATRSWLEGLERDLAEEGGGVDPGPPLAYVAGRAVPIDPGLLHAARRRAMLVLAAGGDPHRALGLGDRAVTLLAEDLDAPGLRAALATGLSELLKLAGELPLATGALERLVADPELAWRSYACALLAEELAEE